MEGSDSHRHMSNASADCAVFRFKAIGCLEVAWRHKENFLAHTRSGLLFFPASIGSRGDLVFFHLKLNGMWLQELLACWTCVPCDSDAGNWNLNADRKSV